MNRMMKTAFVVGAGMAAYNYAKKNNLLSNRNMKRFQKKVRQSLF